MARHGDQQHEVQQKRTMPKGSHGHRYLAITVEAWRRFWQSPMAAFVNDADLATVDRWVIMLDDWHRLVRKVRKTPVVKGSAGQPVANPEVHRLERLEDRLWRLSRELGLTPLGRMQLGLTLAAGELTGRKVDQIDREERKAKAKADVSEEFPEWAGVDGN